MLLRDLGVETRALLRRAQLPEDLFSCADASLGTVEYFRLWRALEREVPDPAFPIRLGEQVRGEMFHPLMFAALSSSNFGVAARRIAQYKRLVLPMQVLVHEDPDRLTIEIGWLDRSVEPPISLATFEQVFLVQLIRMATREHVCPLSVHVPHPPKPVARYTEFFGVAVARSDGHSLSFSAADARRPFLTANEAMWRAFEPALRQRLTELDTSATVRERVRAALFQGLPGGESSMAHIARKLGLSTRTVQRHLYSEDTSFQAVLDSTREELARHYLTKTQLSGAEISYLLGFGDPNSFFRAFVSWTGKTTEQIRLEL